MDGKLQNVMDFDASDAMYLVWRILFKPTCG
jgi:hypothetical protein